jgi:hypothetical protein
VSVGSTGAKGVVGVTVGSGGGAMGSKGGARGGICVGVKDGTTSGRGVGALTVGYFFGDFGPNGLLQWLWSLEGTLGGC